MKKLFLPILLVFVIAACSEDALQSVQDDASIASLVSASDSTTTDSTVVDTTVVDTLSSDSVIHKPHHRRGHHMNVDSLKATLDSATLAKLDSLRALHSTWEMRRDSLKTVRDSLRLIGDSTSLKPKAFGRDMQGRPKHKRR